MGLVIYLYTKQEDEANNAHWQAWESYYQQWGDKPDSPEKAAAREAVTPYRSSETVPSQRYPDHLFGRRYLRSSYNSGGFDNAVPDMVGADHGLYWIFEPVIGDNPEPYETHLTSENIGALEEVQKRALQVAEEIRTCDPLRTLSAHCTLGDGEWMWPHLPTEEQVLAWYREEQQRHEGRKDDTFEGYSTAKGQVFGFTKGLEVLAVTVGANPLADFSAMMPAGTLGASMGAMPHAILVYRLDDEAKDSYIQSAEIVAEFCDEAVELIGRDGSCFMHWSG